MKPKTEQSDNHPDRDEMLRAIKTGQIPFRRHLEMCGSCRRIYDWLLFNSQVESLELTTPSLQAYRRHSTLPLMDSNWVPRRTVVEKSMRDSWTGLPATVTRDSAMGLERNLRFVSGAISLELVADRTPEGWRFAARCYRGEVPSGEFVLKVGKVRMRPGLHDCYSWTSLKPPRTIQLLSPSLRLVFDTETW